MTLRGRSTEDQKKKLIYYSKITTGNGRGGRTKGRKGRKVDVEVENVGRFRGGSNDDMEIK